MKISVSNICKDQGITFLNLTNYLALTTKNRNRHSHLNVQSSNISSLNYHEVRVLLKIYLARGNFQCAQTKAGAFFQALLALACQLTTACWDQIYYILFQTST